MATAMEWGPQALRGPLRRRYHQYTRDRRSSRTMVRVLMETQLAWVEASGRRCRIGQLCVCINTR